MEVLSNNKSSEKGNNLVLVPEDTFFTEKEKYQEPFEEEGLSRHLQLVQVQYGFVPSNNILQSKWFDSNCIDVIYENGRNLEVNVPIPVERQSVCHLAYILYFAPLQSFNKGEKFQSETRFVNLLYDPLQRPEGKFVKLPIKNFAFHPWHESLYKIRISHYAHDESDPNRGVVQFSGKIKYVFYGFTESTEQQYLETPNKDVPWINSFGEFKEEGILDISIQQHQHNGFIPPNKGCFVMNDLWVRLPDTKTKLVWKIGFDTYSGKSWETKSFQGYSETQTFLYHGS